MAPDARHADTIAGTATHLLVAPTSPPAPVPSPSAPTATASATELIG